MSSWNVSRLNYRRGNLPLVSLADPVINAELVALVVAHRQIANFSCNSNKKSSGIRILKLKTANIELLFPPRVHIPRVHRHWFPENWRYYCFHLNPPSPVSPFVQIKDLETDRLTHWPIGSTSAHHFLRSVQLTFRFILGARKWGDFLFISLMIKKLLFNQLTFTLLWSFLELVWGNLFKRRSLSISGIVATIIGEKQQEVQDLV